MTRDPLRVRHCTTHHPKPLAVVTNLPGFDAELTPDQLRLLAAALVRAADDCEALFEQTRWYGPVRREYSLEAA